MGPLKQTLYRIGYYIMDAVGPRDAVIEATFHIRGQAYQVELNGRNRQFNSLYFSKYAMAYEPEVSLALGDFSNDDSVFLDIGSNWGYFSVYVASPDTFRGTVHAFEPSPESFEDLAGLISDLRLGDTVTCHRMALGSESTELTMSVPRHSGLARINRDGTGRPVAVRPLDTFEFERVDLIKLDVEGFEFDVIKGGEATLLRCRPVIVFENNTNDAGSSATLSLLRKASYELFIPRIGIATEGGVVTTHEPYRLEASRIEDYRNFYYPLVPESRQDYGDNLNIVAIPQEGVRNCPRVVRPGS